MGSRSQCEDALRAQWMTFSSESSVPLCVIVNNKTTQQTLELFIFGTRCLDNYGRALDLSSILVAREPKTIHKWQATKKSIKAQKSYSLATEGANYLPSEVGARSRGDPSLQTCGIYPQTEQGPGARGEGRGGVLHIFVSVQSHMYTLSTTLP